VRRGHWDRRRKLRLANLSEGNGRFEVRLGGRGGVFHKNLGVCHQDYQGEELRAGKFQIQVAANNTTAHLSWN
jgi:hypothetical protein